MKQLFTFIVLILLLNPVLSRAQLTFTCPPDGEVQCIFKVPEPFATLADFVAAGGVASSPCGIDETSFSMISQVVTGNCPRTIERTYEVTDLCDETATCVHTIIQFDVEPPLVICPDDITVSVGEGCESQVDVPVAEAFDNCGIVDLWNSYNGTGNASGVYPAGETQVWWYANDTCNNIDSCMMLVTVIDNVSPTIICPANISQPTDPGICNAYVTVPQPIISDNCAIASYSNSYNGSTDASGIYYIGANIISWIVYDEAGNVANCQHTITITDDILPVMTCPPDTLVLIPGDSTEVYLELQGATASDNCGIDSVWNDYTGMYNASAVYPAGITTVTWLAGDIYGNVAQCTTRINVQPMNSILENRERSIPSANYPEPFSLSTRISFSLKEASPVTLTIFDQYGRNVLNIDLGRMDRGENEFIWEPLKAGNGLYFYRIDAGGYFGSGKMMKVR